MILAGQLADASDVERFHWEARAAGRLIHPNIVPVHQIGKHDGRHYFTMDFVEGRSLAEQIRDETLPPRAAAKLVRSIAEAVQYGMSRPAKRLCPSMPGHLTMWSAWHGAPPVGRLPGAAASELALQTFGRGALYASFRWRAGYAIWRGAHRANKSQWFFGPSMNWSLSTHLTVNDCVCLKGMRMLSTPSRGIRKVAALLRREKTARSAFGIRHQDWKCCCCVRQLSGDLRRTASLGARTANVWPPGKR